jgi:hypothetical protein
MTHGRTILAMLIQRLRALKYTINNLFGSARNINDPVSADCLFPES